MSIPGRKFLLPEERRALLAYLDDQAIIARAKGHRVPVRDNYMFLVLFASGVRPTELANQRVADLHLGRSEVSISVRRLKRRKRNVIEDVALPKALRRLMVAYLEWLKAAGLSTAADAPLFPNRTGRSMTRSGISRRWKAALKAAGLSTRFQLRATRHTAGTLMYARSRDLRAVQRQLGHVKITTTQQYVGLLDDDYQDAVDAGWED